jgi:DDE domain
VIVVAIRWYLRYGLSYRDVEELLVERRVEVDHVTVFRWVQRFTPLLADAARFCRHSPGDRWFVDETYLKVNGVWRYVYRAVDQYRAGHRRAGLGPPGRARRPPVLPTGADQLEGAAEGGGHRRRPGLVDGLDEADPVWVEVGAGGGLADQGADRVLDE